MYFASGLSKSQQFAHKQNDVKDVSLPVLLMISKIIVMLVGVIVVVSGFSNKSTDVITNFSYLS